MFDATASPEDPEFWEALCHEQRRDPSAWLSTARMLKRAADGLASTFQAELQARVLYGDPPSMNPSVGPAYMLLGGYAIENLVKGSIVARDLNVAEFRKHLSCELVARASIELNDDENDLIRQLSHFINWAGRYPVPRAESAINFARPGSLRYGTDDPRRVDALFLQLEGILVDRVSSRSAPA